MMSLQSTQISLKSLQHMDFKDKIIDLNTQHATVCLTNPKVVIAGSSQGEVFVRHLDTQSQAKTVLSLENQPILSITDLYPFYLVISQGSNDVAVVKIGPGKADRVQSLRGHLRQPTCIKVTPQLIVSGAQDFTIRIWTKQYPFQHLKILSGHKSTPRALQSYGDSTIISADESGQIIFWRYKQKHLRSMKTDTLKSIISLLVCNYTNTLLVSTPGQVSVYSLAHTSDIIFGLPLMHTISHGVGQGKLTQMNQHFFCVWNQNKLVLIEKFLKQCVSSITLKFDSVNLAYCNGALIVSSKQAVYLNKLQPF